MRSLASAFLLSTAAMLFGQPATTARQVYESSQESVFLVYLNDLSGTPTALGSAFLVAPKTLITNAHVVTSGTPVLAVGPVRIPLKIIRIDEENDLAVLSVDADLTSKPLPLASIDASPGDPVFAIGNPEGLEKTLSQGIVSGLRDRDGRTLLQITSPISHGSSGGPILNTKGEVVGVAVGMLQEGQNLNFAVPVRFVREILKQKSVATANLDVDAILAQMTQLKAQLAQTDYSADLSSDYQRNSKKLLALMGSITTSTNREDALTNVACLGTTAWDFSDQGILAARKLVQLRPSASSRALLAYVLYDRAEDESGRAFLSDKDSEAQSKATEAHKNYLRDASLEASLAAKTAKGNNLLIANYVLGSAKSEKSEYADAISFQSPVAVGSSEVCGINLSVKALQELISDSASAQRPDDAEKWFREYASAHEPAAYEWDSEGDRRSHAQDLHAAADAYEKAAGESDYFGYDYCFAAADRYYQPTTDSDAVLTDGKKCVDESVRQTSKDSEHDFKNGLPIVYRLMAEILESRGVYPTALEYIRETLSANPNDAFALNTEAKVFQDLQQYPECISAAQAAIAASDGKYPWMHFVLGACNFAVQNWTQAAASFRIAAESDNTDAVSAFNLGLSLARQGFTSDANHWLREALNRHPDAELRAKIVDILQ